MNNLTTRKIVLGMLMGLVLAFSVQGTADAGVTLSKSDEPSTSGEYQREWHNRSLLSPLVFTVGQVDKTADVDDQGTETTNDDTTEGPDSITISIARGNTSAGGIDEIRIGSTRVFVNTSSIPERSVTLYGLEDDAEGDGATSASSLDLENGKVSVYCTLGNSTGEYTITVIDAGSAHDEDDEASPIMFTVYAVQNRNDIRAVDESGAATGITGITLDPDADIIYSSVREPIIDVDVTGAADGYALVNLEVTGGEFYLPQPKLGSLGTSFTTHTDNSGDISVRIKPNSRSTVRVRALVEYKASVEATSILYYQDAVLAKEDGDDQEGYPGTQLLKPIVVEVQDGRGKGVSGQKVMFGFGTGEDDRDRDLTPGKVFAVPGTTIDVEGELFDPEDNAIGRTEQPTLTVVSDSSGQAKVYVILDGASATAKTYYQPTARIVGFDHAEAAQKFSVIANPTPSRESRDIRIVSGDRQSIAIRKNAKPLAVVVESDGGVVEGVSVTFIANGGELSFDPDDNFGDIDLDDNDTVTEAEMDSAVGSNVIVDTDANGQASVNYYVGASSGVRRVDAIIRIDPDEKSTTSETFTINVGGARDEDEDEDEDEDDDIITFSRTSITGEAGDEEDIRVTSTPSGVVVSLSSPDFANSNFSPQSETTPFTTTLTLPDETGAHVIFATRSGFTEAEGTVTVEAEGLGRLTISPSGTPTNGVQIISITARTSGGAIPAGAVVVTLSGTGFTTTRASVLNGTVNAGVTLPTTAATYRLTASATGYNSTTTLLTVRTTTTRGPAGEADSVEIDGQRQLSGTVNQAMRLRVRVLDANDDGVEDVRVAFRVLAPGRGTFAGARGNGRATQDQTDRNGYASANFTPSDDGNIIIRASAAGVRDPVTFIIAVGEAADDDDTEPPTPSRDVGPSREISPVVHLGMASRPPMLWVDGGAIYALVGADAQRFAPSVDNAMNITVGGGKVYWTEKTGESGGTVNSANLNGSDVKELASIFATPIGIAVDTAGSKLYWTNSRGRIQSADLDGSGITNVIPGGLESPMDLALAGGNGYWTQGNGSVRVGNLTSRVTRAISTGTDTPGSIVIGGNKVYWTEMTGDSSGTINGANLNGTDVKELTSIQAVPMRHCC